MIKSILGLVACAGLAMGGMSIYSGSLDGSANSGGCCHKPTVSECCSEVAEIPSCCSSLNRSTAISTATKASCCEAVEGAVEVLSVLPREIAAN